MVDPRCVSSEVWWGGPSRRRGRIVVPKREQRTIAELRPPLSGHTDRHQESAAICTVRAHGLKPHLVKTFKLSRDPNFTEKVEDIVGLYVNPPDKALVLSVDEKRDPMGS